MTAPTTWPPTSISLLTHARGCSTARNPLVNDPPRSKRRGIRLRNRLLSDASIGVWGHIRIKEEKWVHFPILPRLLGKIVVKVVSPHYKGKSKTSPLFYPLKSTYGKNITIELLEENQLLIEKFKRCKEDVLDKVMVASPVNGFITYSLRDCIKILVEHEKRHYNQAMRLKLKIETNPRIA